MAALVFSEVIDDADGRLAYHGVWTQQMDRTFVGGTAMLSRMSGERVVFNFTGTGISVHGALALTGDQDRDLSVAIDGNIVGTYTFDPQNREPRTEGILYASPVLKNTRHTVVVTNGGQWLWIDYFDTTSTQSPLRRVSEQAIPSPTANTLASSTDSSLSTLHTLGSTSTTGLHPLDLTRKYPTIFQRDANDDPHKISPGVVAGIAVGSLGAVILVALLVFVYKYTKKNRMKMAAMVSPTPYDTAIRPRSWSLSTSVSVPRSRTSSMVADAGATEEEVKPEEPQAIPVVLQRNNAEASTSRLELKIAMSYYVIQLTVPAKPELPASSLKNSSLRMAPTSKVVSEQKPWDVKGSDDPFGEILVRESSTFPIPDDILVVVIAPFEPEYAEVASTEDETSVVALAASSAGTFDNYQEIAHPLIVPRADSNDTTQTSSALAVSQVPFVGDPSSSSTNGLSTATIVGISVAGVVSSILLAAGLIYWATRKRGRRRRSLDLNPAVVPFDPVLRPSPDLFLPLAKPTPLSDTESDVVFYRGPTSSMALTSVSVISAQAESDSPRPPSPVLPTNNRLGSPSGVCSKTQIANANRKTKDGLRASCHGCY
ncbi:hypothetical protein EIP91_000176 [Steccherinum ochraceum]|uniref:Uncharacterized protein n=1 Tax=Steccherinum ochraceum TaxID=92696 RepID=A0A4R0S379_9APHY|nr:hypothetical protein EIP91_000176 [Steccherinum ochraceum]